MGSYLDLVSRVEHFRFSTASRGWTPDLELGPKVNTSKGIRPYVKAGGIIVYMIIACRIHFYVMTAYGIIACRIVADGLFGYKRRGSERLEVHDGSKTCTCSISGMSPSFYAQSQFLISVSRSGSLRTG